MTVLHVERHYPHPHTRSDFEREIGRLVEQMRPFALWVDVAASVVDADVVSVLSEWRTDADLDAFLAGSQYPHLSQGLDPHVRESPTVRRFHSA